MRDWLDSDEFHELMQAYRHANSPEQYVDAYEAVKEYIKTRRNRWLAVVRRLAKR